MIHIDKIAKGNRSFSNGFGGLDDRTPKLHQWTIEVIQVKPTCLPSASSSDRHGRRSGKRFNQCADVFREEL